MEQKKNLNLIVGGLIAGLVLLFVLVWLFMPAKYNWQETYKKGEKEQPYDTGVLYDLLSNYFPSKEFTEIGRSFEEELPISEELSSYVFVGDKIHLRSAEADYLLKYVDQGNDVLISTRKFPHTLITELYNAKEGTSGKIFGTEESPEEEAYTEEEIYSEEEAYTEEEVYGEEETQGAYVYDEDEQEYVWDEEASYDETEGFDLEETDLDEGFWDSYKNDDSKMLWSSLDYLVDSVATFNYLHPNLKDKKGYTFKHKVVADTVTRRWDYFSEELMQDVGLDYTVLGQMNADSPNFIRIPYGEGHIYLHSSPYAFTNYHLLDEHKLEYAGKVFSHLDERDIYWDQKSTRQARLDDMMKANSSPLVYILSQKSLSWAWYLMMTMILFYVLFRAKREQRIIPVLAGNANTSLEFINTIGRLYFLKNDHRKLAKRKMQLFLAYVRDHYKIPTITIDQDMKERLASKAEVPISLVEDIFIRFQRIDRATNISEDYLVNFHQSLEQFYQKCK